MCYLRLSGYDFINELQKSQIEQYLNNMTSNSVFTQSEFTYINSFNKEISQKILQALCNDNILVKIFAIRCPHCGYMIKTVDDINNLDECYFCVNCEDYINITSDDIIVIYKLRQSPFVDGQQIKQYIQNQNQNFSAVQIEDSLSILIKDGIANNLFYHPSEEEYVILKEKFDKIFTVKTNKEKGNTFEDLVKYLFNLCSHFKANSIRIGNNQIDCYARNSFSVPLNIHDNIYQDIIIECKNESDKPHITYLNKIHSILKTANKKHGIIFSKLPAPKTFKETLRDIYLNDKILIISIDEKDLNDIVINKKNFLECIDRKFNEIIIDSKSNLLQAGLYSA